MTLIIGDFVAHEPVLSHTTIWTEMVILGYWRFVA